MVLGPKWANVIVNPLHGLVLRVELICENKKCIAKQVCPIIYSLVVYESKSRMDSALGSSFLAFGCGLGFGFLDEFVLLDFGTFGLSSWLLFVLILFLIVDLSNCQYYSEELAKDILHRRHLRGQVGPQQRSLC